MIRVGTRAFRPEHVTHYHSKDGELEILFVSGLCLLLYGEEAQAARHQLDAAATDAIAYHRQYVTHREEWTALLAQAYAGGEAAAPLMFQDPDAPSPREYFNGWVSAREPLTLGGHLLTLAQIYNDLEDEWMHGYNAKTNNLIIASSHY